MATQTLGSYKLQDLGVANPGTKVTVPTAPQLTDRNISGLSTLAMPSLSVYQPDYAGLQSSFDQLMGSFDQYKQAAQSGYEAQKASATSNLEQQLQSIGTAKTENKQVAAENRAQIQQDLLMQNRATQRAASARGLGGSGVEALAQIQNRMAAGESISNMSNDYFKAQEQLVTAEQNARTNFDNSMQNLNASLQSTMAQIMSQEASTQMNYTQTIESMKRQVIADQNAVAQAQYEWQAAQAQLEQGAQITESMIYQGMQAAAGDRGAQIAFLQSLGMTAAEANLYALQFNNKQASATLSKQQADYAMLKARGYSSDEINTYMDNTYGVTGWDPSKMTTGTTTAKTSTSLFPTQSATTTPSTANVMNNLAGYSNLPNWSASYGGEAPAGGLSQGSLDYWKNFINR